jgi:hypothetical protein
MRFSCLATPALGAQTGGESERATKASSSIKVGAGQSRLVSSELTRASYTGLLHVPAEFEAVDPIETTAMFRELRSLRETVFGNLAVPLLQCDPELTTGKM